MRNTNNLRLTNVDSRAYNMACHFPKENDSFNVGIQIKRQHIFDSQANFKVWGFFFGGPSSGPLGSLTRMFGPIFCFGGNLMDLISNWGGE